MLNFKTKLKPTGKNHGKKLLALKKNYVAYYGQNNSLF